MNKKYFQSISIIILLTFIFSNVIPAPVFAADPRVIEDVWSQDNGLEALTAQYGKDNSSPFNNYFANRNEQIRPEDGALVLKENDLILPGRNGLDLEISRYYRNSQANLNQMTTTQKSFVNWYYVPPSYGYTWTYVTGWTEYKYVPGYYDYVYTPGRIDWVWVPGRLEWVFHFDPVTMTFHSGYISHPGRYEMVWVPARYDMVWIPGSYTSYYHPGYYDYKWGEISPGYYDYYTDYYYISSTDPNTFMDNANGLGSGWSFAFPRVENNGNNLFYHSASGNITQVDYTSVSHLKDYSLQDRIFDNDNGSFSNGQMASKYMMSYKDGKKEFFGSDGRLLGIVDRYGNTIKFEHTMIGGYARISRITDTIGRTVNITYLSDRVIVSDGTRNYTYNLGQVSADKMVLSSVTDSLNRTTEYEYSLDNAAFDFLSRTSREAINVYANLVKIYHPTGAITNYAYTKGIKNLGGSGSMEYFKVTSRNEVVNGVTVNNSSFSYQGEADGFPSYNKDNLPSTYTFSTQITGSDGTITTATYNSDSREIKREQKGSGIHTVNDTQYAANGTPQKISSTSYSSGGGSSVITTSMQYNDYNDLISQVSPDGVRTNYAYGSYHQVAKIEKLGATGQQKTEYTIDSYGNMTAEKKHYTKNGTASTITTFYTYDTYGNCISAQLQMEDGSRRNTFFEYSPEYGSAYQTKVTRSAHDTNSSITSYTYNHLTGQKISETNALGHTTTYAYDKLGRVTSVNSPAVEAGTGIKKYIYDDANNILRTVSESGATTEYRYDALGRIKTVKDFNGVIVQTRSYNASGQIAEVTDSAGNKLTAQYDGAGRPLSMSLPDGTSISMNYNDAERTVAVTDPKGNVSITKNDIAGRVIQVTQKPALDSSDVYNTYYAYDFLGNCTQVTQANGQATIYSYDVLSRLNSITYPDSKIAPMKFKYNNAGEQVAKQDKNTTEYEYNGLGQLLKIKYEDGSYAAFTYDLLGNRLSDLASASGAASQYTYDALGRKISQTKTIDGVAYTTKYRYDIAGNMTGIQYPGESSFLTYRFNSSNQLTEVQGFLDASHGGGISYYPSGKSKSITYNNGISTNFTYDSRGRLSASESPILNLSYGYDQSGNIVKINDNKYSYDGLNRLIKAEMPSLNQNENYGYDQIGNRTSQTINGQEQTYAYDSVDQLLSAEETIFTYDANGNMISKTAGEDEYGYSFDAANRLLGVTLNGDEISRYTYDADGVRIKKVENGSGTIYVNSGLQYLLTITDGNPVKHIYAMGGRVAQVMNGQTYYIHNDHLGSTRALTDAQGNIISEMEYAPFGAVIRAEGTGDIMLFIGKEMDNTGLYYFGARYYDPEIGRFISRDPVLNGDVDPTRHTPYAYAQSSPLSYVDPDGKFVPVLLGVAAGLTGLASLFINSSALLWTATIFASAAFGTQVYRTYKNPTPDNYMGLGLSALGLIPGANISKAALTTWDVARIGIANFAGSAGLAYSGAQAANYDWGSAMDNMRWGNYSGYTWPSHSFSSRMDFSYPINNYAIATFSSPYLSTGYNSYNYNNNYVYNNSNTYHSNNYNYPRFNYADLCFTIADPFSHTWRYW